MLCCKVCSKHCVGERWLLGSLLDEFDEEQVNLEQGVELAVDWYLENREWAKEIRE